MFALFRFFGRRLLRRLGSRSRWVSRIVLLVGVARWWNGRPRERRVVRLSRGETLVLGLESDGRTSS